MTPDVPHAIPPTPEELLARFRDQGDPTALGALFDATAPELFRVALSLTPDAASAEDALQETYIVLMEDATRWDASRRVVPWLAGILRLKIHEVRRRVGRSPDPRRVAASPSHDDDVIDSRAGPEVEARVRAQLEALPETYRAVALMRWRYGLDPAEIAHIRGENPGTTRSLLSRALDRLRDALKGLPAIDFGGRPPRGISAVREAVVSAATIAKTAAAAATVMAAVGGGTLMAGKTWAAAAIVALAMGGGWLALRPHDDSTGVAPGRAATSPPEIATGEITKSDAGPVRQSDLAAGGVPVRAPTGGATLDFASAPFRGIVVDVGGAPIAGANVTVANPGIGAHANSPVPAPCVTRADGRFGFLPAGSVTSLYVGVAAERRIALHDEWLERDKEKTFTLEPAFPLRVRVVDDVSGTPVVGALVEAARATGDAIWFAPAIDSVTSDADGRATLSVSGGDVTAVARRDGYAVGFVRGLRAAPDGADVEVRLRVGATYAFRVVDARGGAVAGAAIRATAYPDWNTETHSDADGSFRIEHLPEFAASAQTAFRQQSMLSLVVRADGHPPLTSGASLETPPKATPVVLAMADWRTLRGRVRNAGGTGVPSATVLVEPDRRFGGSQDLIHEISRTVVTDAAGEFVVEQVAPVGVLVVAKDAAGQKIGQASVYVPQAGEVPVVEIVVAGASARLRVAVIGPDGAPRAGVSIEAYAVHGAGEPPGKAVTDAQGVATLDNLSPRRTWVRALPIDALGADATVELGDSPSAELTLRLGTGVITGRVLRLDGSPVRQSIALTRWMVFTSAGGVHQGMSFPVGPQVETDADGRFQFNGVGDGVYTIQPEYSQARRVLGNQTELRAGTSNIRLMVVSVEESDALRLALDLGDRVTGAPPDANRGMLKVTLRLQGAATQESEIAYVAPVPGTPGRYQSSAGLSPGVYDVELDVDGFLPARVTGVRVGIGGEKTVARMSLDRGGRVEGKVVAADGSPVVYTRVMCGARSTYTERDGTYKVSGLSDGVIDVTVSGRLVRTATKRVEVVAETPARADFTVETAGGVWVSTAGRARPSRSIALRLVSTEGVETLSFEEKASKIEERFEGSDGWGWSLGPVVPGRYRLEGTWDGVALPRKDIEVKDRETARVEIAPP